MPTPRRDSSTAGGSSTAPATAHVQGLRLHDNPALLDAAKHGADALLPVFCLDPHIIASGLVGARRIQFLFESLADLDGSLRERGSRLVVLHGDPAQLIPQAMASWGAAHLCYERDTEPYALTRDAAVAAAVREHGAHVRTALCCARCPALFAWRGATLRTVFAHCAEERSGERGGKSRHGGAAQVHPHDSHTLWPTEALIAKNGGAAPRTMAGMQKLAKRMPKVATVGNAPDSLPGVTEQHLHCMRDALQGGTGDVPTLHGLGIAPAEGDTPFKARCCAGLRICRHASPPSRTLC